MKKVTVEERIPVAMFPEATRSADGSLGDLRLGAAAIAKSLNLPILPITIYNSREILPRGAINPRPGTVVVGIQPLIEEEFTRNHSAEDIKQEIARRLQKGLDDLAQKGQKST